MIPMSATTMSRLRKAWEGECPPEPDAPMKAPEKTASAAERRNPRGHPVIT